MGQNKISIIPLGTTFQVEIPLHEYWLSTWPRTLQSRGLIWYAEESRKDGGFETGVFREGKTEKEDMLTCYTCECSKQSFFAIIAHAKDCMQENIFIICSEGQTALQAIETSRIMSKLALEWQTGNLCPVQSEQGNTPLGSWLQRDSGQWRCRCLAREGSSNSFICAKPAFHMSPHTGCLKINE